MRRGLNVLDRLVVLVVGLAVTAGGLALLDWHYDVAGLAWPETLSTTGVTDALDPSWAAWAVGGGGLLVGLLGLWWLMAHLRRDRVRTRRLAASDASGRLEVDLGSLAGAVADRLQDLVGLDDARGTARRVRGTDVLEVRVKLAPGTDADDLTRAVQQVTSEVAAGLPDDDVALRVLVDPPKNPRTGRTARVAVR